MFNVSAIKLVNSRRFQQVFCYGKYMRKTKDELRAELKSKQFDSVRNAITSALEQRECLSVEEWKSLGADLRTNRDLKHLHNLNKIIFDALLSLRAPNDSLQNARHFIEASNIGNDLSVKCSLVDFYEKKEAEARLTSEEEKELIQMCDEFIAREFHALPEMHSKITQGLCATKDWKKALTLNHPSVGSLHKLLTKALRENEIDLVWELLEKITEVDLVNPDPFTNRRMIAFAKYFQKHPKCIPTMADKFLTFCERMENVFDEASTREFTKVIQDANYAATITNMDYSGVCSVCKGTLSAVKITDEDFQLVKNNFMKNVVEGVDIYQKTTPQEWEKFEDLIRRSGPFDIVMDGLNVSYMANNNNYVTAQIRKRKQQPCTFSLANAVQQLVSEGKRVLVIGRKHMKKYPGMKSIYQNATVFLVEDISVDDIFILYATLYSGPNCYILSNDYMRQHKFAIGRHFDKLFKMWQQEHWYRLTIGQNKAIDLIKPMQFKMHCHKVGNSWHIPFKSDEEIKLNTWSDYDLPKNWACIRIES